MNKNILIKNKIKDFYKKKYVSNNVNNACKENNKIKNIIITYAPLLKNDIIYKIVNRLASRCTFYINIKDYNLTHNELIGCSHEELKDHLENKFQEGMNFDNYGEWELDHIYPISKFNLSDIDEIKKCFNYQNIQPLWKIDNRIKSNKI